MIGTLVTTALDSEHSDVKTSLLHRSLFVDVGCRLPCDAWSPCFNVMQQLAAWLLNTFVCDLPCPDLNVVSFYKPFAIML